MSYTDILKRLLVETEGAIGVGFVAHDGEAVQVEGPFEDYPHRLHLAYQGILLQSLGQIQKIPHTGVRFVLSVHENFVVVLKPLTGGYFLVLTLKHRKHLHQALRHLEEAAQILNQEL